MQKFDFREERLKMKSTKIFVIVLILLIIIAGGLFALKILKGVMNENHTYNWCKETKNTYL